MRILIAALCDRVTTTPDGKLDLRGVFQDLYAPGFPACQDAITLVLVLEWDRDDHGRHNFRVDVRDPEGRPTLTLEGQSEVTPAPAGRPPARTQLVMPIEDVVFPMPGRYALDVRVKGRTLAGPSLHLVEIEDGNGDSR